MSFHLSTMIYPPECVAQAIRAYESVCRVAIKNEEAEGCDIEIDAAERAGDDPNDPEEAIGHFLNYLLELSLEAKLRRDAG